MNVLTSTYGIFRFAPRKRSCRLCRAWSRGFSRSTPLPGPGRSEGGAHVCTRLSLTTSVSSSTAVCVRWAGACGPAETARSPPARFRSGPGPPAGRAPVAVGVDQRLLHADVRRRLCLTGKSSGPDPSRPPRAALRSGPEAGDAFARGLRSSPGSGACDVPQCPQVSRSKALLVLV